MDSEQSDLEALRRQRDQENEREWRRERAEAEREGIAESKRVLDEAEAFQAKQTEKLKKRNAAERTFAEAAEFARRQIKDNGLDGEIRPHHEIRYTLAQGLKAAIHAREDGIATFVLQREILYRLDAIKSLLWVVVALLGFVAYRLL